MEDRDKIFYSLQKEIEYLRARVKELEEINNEGRNIAGQNQTEEKLTKDYSLYRTTIEAMYDSVHVIDRDFRIILFNEAYRNIMSQAGIKGDFKNKYLFVISPFLPDHVLEEYKEVLKTGKPLITLEKTEVNNQIFWTDTRKFPIFDSEGKVYQILTIIRDITERINSEEILRKSQRMLKLVLDNIPARVFWKDTNSVFQGCNRLFALDAGLSSPDQIIGKNDFELAWKEQAEIYRSDDQMVMETKIPKLNYEEPQTTPDGEVRWLLTSKIPLLDRDNHVVGVLGTYSDISERKKAEEEKGKLERKMLHTQKLESLGVLAGGIAHDFNNILVAIVGNADLALLELPAGSPIKIYLSEIERASIRAAEFCKQMLAYAGKGRFVVEPLNLSLIVQEMSQMLEISIGKKTILKYNFAVTIPAIEADATQIRQVIMNLIINASEAITDKNGFISISTGSIHCDRSYIAGSYMGENLTEGSYAYLEVADNGCGMDKETQMKIFDPFFTTKFTGRGLGLAAVLGIVRGHKGFVRVYSEPGKGTTFKVLFPALGATAEELRKDTNILKNVRGYGTILLVDDDVMVLDVGKPMLMKLGFKVLVSSSGYEALEILRQMEASSRVNEDRIVCVILDLTMPGMDGEETFRELRRIKKDIPVVLSSGYNEQEVIQRFSGKGLTGFLPKPYKIETLIEILQKVMPL